MIAIVIAGAGPGHKFMACEQVDYSGSLSVQCATPIVTVVPTPS